MTRARDRGSDLDLTGRGPADVDPLDLELADIEFADLERTGPELGDRGRTPGPTGTGVVTGIPGPRVPAAAGAAPEVESARPGTPAPKVAEQAVTEQAVTEQAVAEQAVAGAVAPRRVAVPAWVRPAAARAGTVLAVVLVYLALIAPNQLGQLTPAALLRLPVEALIGAAAVLLLPPRAGRVLALAAGVLLGLLTVLRVLDMGFRTVLARPFDPVFDWPAIGAGMTFLEGSIGPAGVVAAATGAGALAAALVVALAVATRHLAVLVGRHRRATIRAVPVLTAVWGILAVLGVQIVAPVPVASQSTASLAYRTSVQVPTTVLDQLAFDAQIAAPDPFAEVPATELLSALRGKNVVVTYVESYGRSAVQDPTLAPRIAPVLDRGTDRLAAAGFGARSGFLTSSTSGGGSWLAHATFMSGLWVANQRSYDDLVASGRGTLTTAFQRAGWQTLGVMPGVISDWPEAGFWGVDRVYGSDDLGINAQHYREFRTPDQFTLAAYERIRAQQPAGPIMAEIPLVTSHFPWTDLPSLVEWDEIGDGSLYDPMVGEPEPMEAVLSDPERVRAAYSTAITYSMESIVSWVETYGDDDLVVIVLGDHQPASMVTGPDASKDVPISVVTRDQDVLDRVAAWDWDAGLRPAADAPAWRMDTFRDRFLSTFSG